MNSLKLVLPPSPKPQPSASALLETRALAVSRLSSISRLPSSHLFQVVELDTVPGITSHRTRNSLSPPPSSTIFLSQFGVFHWHTVLRTHARRGAAPSISEGPERRTFVLVGTPHFRSGSRRTAVLGLLALFACPAFWDRDTDLFYAQIKMAEYTTPATGAPANGATMNGSSEQGFTTAPMPASNEAAKTLWYVSRFLSTLSEWLMSDVFSGWAKWKDGWTRTSSRTSSPRSSARLSRSRSSATATPGKFQQLPLPFPPLSTPVLRPDSIQPWSLTHYSTHSNAGYCFIEFATPEAATKALALTGTQVPNSARVFKLNWASGGGLVDRRCVHRLPGLCEGVANTFSVTTAVPNTASSSATLAPRSTSSSSSRYSRRDSRPASLPRL